MNRPWDNAHEECKGCNHQSSALLWRVIIIYAGPWLTMVDHLACMCQARLRVRGLAVDRMGGRWLSMGNIHVLSLLSMLELSTVLVLLVEETARLCLLLLLLWKGGELIWF